MTASGTLGIDICQISKRFGTLQSLDQLTLRVDKGSVCGLLGPNGAGKTTTLRALLGLLQPDSGSISIFGLSPATNGREIRSQVGVLLEADGLYSRLTAFANLDFHSRIWHLTRQQRDVRVEELLRWFDLWERRHEQVINWSKGMRQKLALTRALLHRPRLLLLDEPFSGLDPAAAVELRECVAALARDQDVTVLLATHDLIHVEKVCTHVAVIQKGRVIAEGAPDQVGVKGSAEAEVEVKGRNLTQRTLADMEQQGIILSFRIDGSTAILVCPAALRETLGSELTRRGVLIEELLTRRNTLEDKFISLTSSDRL